MCCVRLPPEIVLLKDGLEQIGESESVRVQTPQQESFLFARCACF